MEDSVARLMDRSQMSNVAIMKEERRDITREFGGDEFNTGASEVQIAIMTRKVANMTEFLKNNRKDKHNTRALQQLLSKRRKMLKYLMRQSRARYYDTIRKLGLRDIYGDKVLKRHGAVKKYPAAKMKGSY
jgi:small subunit ribosomal protein S15